MQQGETECDKHNLFYAHAFSNETNFAHLIFNAMKSAVYAMKKKIVWTSRRQTLFCARNSNQKSNARNSCTCEIPGGILP